MTRYQVLSPDGFPIAHSPSSYRSRAQARKAYLEWAKRYETQGYYRDARWNKIPLADLSDYCLLIEI